MKKKTWREAIKKNPRTKYLLRWERKQRRENIRIGLFYGIWIGVVALIVGVLIGKFIL